MKDMQDLPKDNTLDIYSLNNNGAYFLMPIKLEEGKMFMWYSICSMHRSHAPECAMCATGSWNEIVRVPGEDEVYPEGHNDG